MQDRIVMFLAYFLLVPAATNALSITSRRQAFARAAEAVAGSIGTTLVVTDKSVVVDKRSYVQRFPALFAPLYGEAKRKTTIVSLGEDMWSIEQNLELGPLQVPIRCVVIRLKDGTLWVHNPLAPTEEFFELVESCGSTVAHVVVPTYAYVCVCSQFLTFR